LQDDNRALSDRVAVLEQELAEVSSALEEYATSNNALRAEVKELEKNKVDETALRAACDALAQRVMSAKKEDRRDEDVAALTELKQYLSPEIAGDFEKWLENNQ
jgi:cell division septum initiation protein DivIVA